MNGYENDKTPRQCYEEAIEKLELARRGMVEQAKDIEGIKTKLSITNVELQSTKTDLEATKKQLYDTQKELHKTKDDAENMLVGSITAFATPIPPEGWLECNGQAVSRTIYARLFQKIAITFGAGDGQTTFQREYVTFAAGGRGDRDRRGDRANIPDVVPLSLQRLGDAIAGDPERIPDIIEQEFLIDGP